MKNWLRDQVEKNPRKEAILAENVSITYEELLDLATKNMEILEKLTARNTPNILVLLPNSVEFIVLIHTIMQLQGTLIPLNPNLTLNEIKKYLNEIEVDLVGSLPSRRTWKNRFLYHFYLMPLTYFHPHPSHLPDGLWGFYETSIQRALFPSL